MNGPTLHSLARAARLVVVAALAAFILVACQAGGIGAEDVERIRDRIDEVTARLDALEQRLTALSDGAEVDDVEVLVDEARAEVGEAMTLLAEVSAELTPPPPPPAATEPGLAPGADAPMEPGF
jgi:hypothetical protein